MDTNSVDAMVFPCEHSTHLLASVDTNSVDAVMIPTSPF